MQQIAIIDYHMGNLRSVSKAIEHVAGDAAQVTVTQDPQVIAGADRVVFPGQGAAHRRASASGAKLAPSGRKCRASASARLPFCRSEVGKLRSSILRPRCSRWSGAQQASRPN